MCVNMTAQVPDQFKFNEEEYSIIGVKDSHLFNPKDFNLKPRMASTACYRGFVVEYNCKNNELIVENLLINLEKPSKINGIKPKKIYSYGLKYLYENLNLKLNFTGKILIARDFIDEMYVHMGYQRPIAFKKVIELQIEKGTIINTTDFSSIIAKLREEDPNKNVSPEYDETTLEWIDRLFSLDYNLPM